jgi:endogenous inhibitor of DNA gyrase (YacG/DUF329 family)
MNGKKTSDSKPQSSERCRVCNAPIPHDADHKGPFCSHRCKLQDLSKWFGEEYRVGSSHAPSPDSADGNGEE